MQVRTHSGLVEGHDSGGHMVFRGIPYAAPPVGPRRFQPPRPVSPWEGVRPAHEFGPGALQYDSDQQGIGAPGPKAEDCLYLNVYTPAADDARRPVMVWVHGGIYVMGSSSNPIYDGGRLAERGDVVVVTINYRLGALGFLGLRDQGGDAIGATANAGQLDQCAALSWVKRNIAAFGGNPDDVTVFGESAGAFACSLLMCMPAAKGLFHKVICQSGAAWALSDRDSVRRRTGTFLSHLGIAPGQAQELLDVSPERILEAQGAVWARHGRLAFFPSLDPDTIPRQPRDAFSAGESRSIPLLIGSNRDEWNFFAMATLGQRDRPMDDEALFAALVQEYGEPIRPALPRLVQGYRVARAARGVPTGNRYILDAIIGDRAFRIPAIRIAEARAETGLPAHMYLLTHESPAKRGLLGACHALELALVFGTLDAPTQDRFVGAGAAVEALSRQMMDTWLAFARTGSPNADRLPAFGPYEPPARATMIFGPDGGMHNAPLDGERMAWDHVTLRAPA